MPITRSVIRWAGNKRQLVRRLLSMVPRSYCRYYEPFCGSACLFFALRPVSGVLGDVNEDLVNAHRLISRHPNRLLTALASIGTSRSAYYAMRKADPISMNPLDRAARFIYLMQNCYGGMYRTDKQGRFNVPRSRYPTPLPSPHRFRQCSVALRIAEIRLGDFETTLTDVERGDFVYLDPPYLPLGRIRAGEYGHTSFSETDVPRLTSAIRMLDARGAAFLLSYFDSHDLLEAIDSRWHVTRVTTKRTIARHAHHRGRATELLVSNRPLST